MATAAEGELEPCISSDATNVMVTSADDGRPSRKVANYSTSAIWSVQETYVLKYLREERRFLEESTARGNVAGPGDDGQTVIIIIPLFHTVVDNPQLHNKLPRRTAQIQLNTQNQL